MSERTKRTTARPAARRAASDKVVARLVLRLRREVVRPGLAQALRVGGMLCRAIYGGEPGRCAVRRRRGPLFARLVKADGQPFSALTLSRFLGVYELYDRIGGRSFRFAALSHYYAVLPLPRRQQEMALVAACGNRWPATKLEAMVRRWRRSRPSRSAAGSQR
jgi:hypothetical protein